MTDKHVAIYIRVSTSQQDTASQKPDLERWAEGQRQPVKWYHDKISGKTMDRPGMGKVLAAIERGEVSAVVCWRLDRLGRTAKGLTALFEDLQKARVNLVSLKDGLDLTTPAGRLMANVLASVAMFETEVRAERILAGQAVAKANGKTWGGSEPGRLIANGATKEQVDAIQKMSRAGSGVTEIARATGLSRPTVYRHLA